MTLDTWTAEDIARKQAEGHAAAETFARTLLELRAALVGADPIEVLARTFLHVLIHQSRKPDPKKSGLEVFHLEILQGLVLTATERRPGTAEQAVDTTALTSRLIDENGQAYRLLWQRKLTEDPLHNSREALFAFLRHWTMAVRGPRHAHQTLEYLEGMVVATAGPFRSSFKCHAAQMLALLQAVPALLQSRVNAHVAFMRRWMTRKRGPAATIDAFVDGMEETEAARHRAAVSTFTGDAEHLQAYFWNECEKRLAAILIFSIDEVLPDAPSTEKEGLERLFDSLALSFGEVSEDDLKHLHLDNPVRLKPFIRLGDGQYFCPNPFSLTTNLSEIFETLCQRHAATKAALEKGRANWLETKLMNTLRTFLPSAEVHQSVKWTDPATGIGWESDAVAIIDKTVLIFEAKSHRIKPAARRGALNSLKEALKDLVVAPSEQSARLKAYIEGASIPLTFETRDGTLVIDPAILRDVIRVNILQDVVGPLSAHWPQLKVAGLVPADSQLAPTMSIFDLETVFEALTLEMERCHYLHRRVIFERNVTYTADELDLLAFYLENQFNVGDEELSHPTYVLFGRSSQVAYRYSEHREAGTLRFPIKRTDQWQALLVAIERQKAPGWTRFGHRLLNVDLLSQRRFGKMVEKGFKAMRRSPGHFFTTGLTIGSGERKQTIAFAISGHVAPELFRANLEYATRSATEQGGMDNILLICWFLPKTGEAYDFIGVMRQKSVYSVMPILP